MDTTCHKLFILDAFYRHRLTCRSVSALVSDYSCGVMCLVLWMEHLPSLWSTFTFRIYMSVCKFGTKEIYHLPFLLLLVCVFVYNCRNYFIIILSSLFVFPKRTPLYTKCSVLPFPLDVVATPSFIMKMLPWSRPITKKRQLAVLRNILRI